MSRISVLIVTVALTACGYSESDYVNDEVEASCAFTVACYPGLYDSMDDCVETAVGVLAVTGCVFDSEAARECVDGIEAMDCPEDGAVPPFPPACDAVYGDCDSPS